MESKYKEIALEIQKLEPHLNDIIVISFRNDITAEHLANFADALKPHIPEDVTILCTRGDISIDRIPEQKMNEMGWYKFNTTNNKH